MFSDRSEPADCPECLWPVVVTLLTLAPCVPRPGSASEPDIGFRLRTVSHVSDQFRRQTEMAWGTIPDHVRRGIERSGYRVQLAEFVIDARPRLRGVRPRGWPADTTWDNTDAMHLPGARLLVLAEKRRTVSGNVVPSSRVDGVLRHELGHAFDMVSGGRYRFHSSTPAFIEVYRQDTTELAAGARRELAYYLQDHVAGRQETFAESFAILLGGGSDPPHRQQFKAAFPAVADYVHGAIQQYRP